MDGQEKFWLSFFGIVGTLICVLIISISVYYNNVSKRITEMVKSGADPILAKCALDAPQDRTLCSLPYLNDK